MKNIEKQINFILMVYFKNILLEMKSLNVTCFLCVLFIWLNVELNDNQEMKTREVNYFDLKKKEK